MRRNRILRALALALACVGAVVHPAFGQAHYQLPPKAIVDILDAKPLPTVAVSPSRQEIALLERSSMPTIAELSQPMLRLAGARINPRTNGPQRPPPLTGITHPTAVRQPEDQGGGAARGETRLARLLGGRPPHRVHRDQGGRNRAVDGGRGDGRREGRSRAPSSTRRWAAVRVGQRRQPAVPDRPGHARAGTQGAARARRPEHPGEPRQGGAGQHLRGPAEETRTTRRCSSTTSPASWRSSTRQRARPPVGAPAIFDDGDCVANGEFILVVRLKRPFSRLRAASRTSRKDGRGLDQGGQARQGDRRPAVERDRADGRRARRAARLHVEPGRAGDASRGPRRSTAATCGTAVPQRDRLVRAAGAVRRPAAGSGSEFEHRFQWHRVDERERRARHRVRAREADAPGVVRREGRRAPRGWELSAEDRYKDPGRPVVEPRFGGGPGVIMQVGDDDLP